MGFRSNFITEDVRGLLVPQWFIEKYPQHFVGVNSATERCFPIVQWWESKFYSAFAETDIFQDIQKVLAEQKTETRSPSIVLILLHECRGITRVKITPDAITAKEPTEWKEVSSVEHDYCYGCSD